MHAAKVLTTWSFGLASLLRGAAVGGRWFFRDDGSGGFLSLNLSFHRFDGGLLDADGTLETTILVSTVTAGDRWTWDAVFLQAGVGGGVTYQHRTWTNPPSPTNDVALTPDVTLGLGWRF